MRGLERIEALSDPHVAMQYALRLLLSEPEAARRAAWSTIRVLAGPRSRRQPKGSRIGFSGGEPLLEFPLMRRAVAHVEKTRPAGKTVTYYEHERHAPHGGRSAGFLEEYGFETQLSFDGVIKREPARAGHLLLSRPAARPIAKETRRFLSAQRLDRPHRDPEISNTSPTRSLFSKKAAKS